MARRHEVTRLEGFSDAVFGFALTLLVVSLEVPQDIDGLANLMRGSLPFGLMFAMICYIWYEHQKFFRHYGLQDAGTVAINAVLLFVVLFYVYPLKYLTLGLLGRPLHIVGAPSLAGSAGAVLLMYSGGVVLIFGAFTALYQRAWRRRDALALSEAERTTLRYTQRGHLLSLGLGVASIILTLVGTAVAIAWFYTSAGLIYSLMGPLHAWNGYAARRAHERLRTSRP